MVQAFSGWPDSIRCHILFVCPQLTPEILFLVLSTHNRNLVPCALNSQQESWSPAQMLNGAGLQRQASLHSVPHLVPRARVLSTHRNLVPLHVCSEVTIGQSDLQATSDGRVGEGGRQQRARSEAFLDEGREVRVLGSALLEPRSPALIAGRAGWSDAFSIGNTVVQRDDGKVKVENESTYDDFF
jgi:hypothetical protein